MKDDLLKNFNVFIQLLVKGAVFVYGSYGFGEDEPSKPRPIIILNCKPPQDRKENIFYSTLSGSNIERYARNKPKGIVILRDDKLRYTSAFNLGRIISENSGKFHEDFLANVLFYPGLLSEENIKYVHKEICTFVTDKKTGKTISKVIRRAIYEE